MEINPGLRQLRFGDNVIGPLAHDPHRSIDAGEQFPAQSRGRTQGSTASSATPVPMYAEFTDSKDSDTNDEMTAE
jgi:hypothetical protein